MIPSVLRIYFVAPLSAASQPRRENGLWQFASAPSEIRSSIMATEKQRNAARKNIKKAAQSAKRKRTIAHLPKATRTALGKQAAKVARQRRSS
jgi:hypothetical protein